MKQFWMAALVGLLLAMALVGCGGAATPAANPTAAGKSATVQPAATVAPTAEKSSAPTAAPTAVPQQAAKAATTAPKAAATAPKAIAKADESLSLDNRAEGLDKLKSYTMRWQAQWKSTDASKPESSSWDWIEDYTSQPQALHFKWNVTDSAKAQGAGVWEMWQIGNTSYMATTDDKGKANCMSFSSEDKSQQVTKGLFSPSMLGSLHDAKFVGNETINGVAAKHYRYDQSSARLAGMGKASGETWVAVDGGYVVKDLLNWDGAAGFFGAGASAGAAGAGQWKWELSNVNQAITIKPPDNCGGGANDLPLLKDATEKSTFGDTVMYKSATKLADAADFYKKAMANAGWQPLGEPQVTDEFASLDFVKPDRKVSIMITADKDTIQVIITAGK